LEFTGFGDIQLILTTQGWDELGHKKLLAKWADRVKVQNTVRTTTGTEVQQGTSVGSLPTDA